MEFRKLHYIIKISELGNITRAAEQLYISQSALSHYLTRVEKELGAAIFDRSTNPLKLTPAGECYVDTAKKIIELDEGMRRQVQILTRQKQEKLRIGMSPERTAYMLPRLLSVFAKEHPGIKIETIERNVTDCEVAVLQKKADVAIVPLPVKNSGLKGQFIYRETISLLAPKGWLDTSNFPSRQAVDFSLIGNLPIILLKEGHRARTVFDEFCTRSVYTPNIVMETSSMDAALSLVKEEIGMAVVPTFYVENLAPQGLVESFLLPVNSNTWDVGLIYRENHELTFAEQELLSILHRNFQDRQ